MKWIDYTPCIIKIGGVVWTTDKFSYELYDIDNGSIVTSSAVVVVVVMVFSLSDVDVLFSLSEQ